MINLFFIVSLVIGEKLEYSAHFGFLRLGKMTLNIEDTLTYKNRKCYRISSYLNSSPGLKFLFSLNDTVEVYTMQDNLLPLSYEEKIKESKYRYHTRLLFNHESLFVICDDTLRDKISKDTYDLLSFWYYFRTIPLVEGDTIRLNIYQSKTNYKIESFIRNGGVVKTALGEFKTKVVVPETKGRGIFGSKGGMEIWYTDDERKLPVQIKTSMKYGTILFKLKEVRY